MSHIYLSHKTQTSSKPSELSTFSCQLCPCPELSNEQAYFSHVNEHLQRNETVSCMFKDCTFKTNIYNTFHSFIVAGLIEFDNSVIDGALCAEGTDVESDTCSVLLKLEHILFVQQLLINYCRNYTFC